MSQYTNSFIESKYINFMIKDDQLIKDGQRNEQWYGNSDVNTNTYFSSKKQGSARVPKPIFNMQGRGKTPLNQEFEGFTFITIVNIFDIFGIIFGRQILNNIIQQMLLSTMY